jgi:hypothetical protein
VNATIAQLQDELSYTLDNDLVIDAYFAESVVDRGNLAA